MILSSNGTSQNSWAQRSSSSATLSEIFGDTPAGRPVRTPFLAFLGGTCWAYQPLVSLNEVLSNPYFCWGMIGGGSLTSHQWLSVICLFGGWKETKNLPTKWWVFHCDLSHGRIRKKITWETNTRLISWGIDKGLHARFALGKCFANHDLSWWFLPSLKKQSHA